MIEPLHAAAAKEHRDSALNAGSETPAPTFHGAGLIGLLEAGGMPRERIVEHLDVASQLLSEWAEAIEPMPMDEYAALLALLTDMIHDVEAVVADAEAACE